MPKHDKYHAKWKAHMAKCSKYHAKCKVTMPKCSKYHAKRQVLVPNCCKYKANGTGKESKKQFQNLRQKKQKTILHRFGTVTALLRAGLNHYVPKVRIPGLACSSGLNCPRSIVSSCTWVATLGSHFCVLLADAVKSQLYTYQ